MGMAASQARLLSLTSRMHDVEFQAQSIESQKIALATQRDELYKDYCDALDATTIKVAMLDSAGRSSYVAANFSSLCEYNPMRQNDYALKDNKSGNLIVTEEAKNAYDKFGSDKFTFAWAMLGMTSFGSEAEWTNSEESGMGIGYFNKNYVNDDLEQSGYPYHDGTVLHLTENEAAVFENHKDDVELVALYDEIALCESKAEKQEALDAFRDKLYTKYSSEIFSEMNTDKSENAVVGATIDSSLKWDELKQEFNYYAGLWDMINEAGGCQVVNGANATGDQGSEWFNNVVESGLVSIWVRKNDGSYSNEWAETSIATSTSANNLRRESDDTDLKKAEAEYEHELGVINSKDTKFDTELSKLETERTSIKTEIEAIKTVKDDNIERTFGIFS